MSENKGALRVLARLSSESELMYSLRRDGKIEVEGEGAKPFHSYKVTVFGETYVKPDDQNGKHYLSGGPHVFRIKVTANYPLKEAPVVSFLTQPPAHINVFRKGGVCIGRWKPDETLASETVRTLRVLFLDPSTYNYKSIADKSCESFCRSYSGGIPKDFPLACPAFDK